MLLPVALPSIPHKTCDYFSPYVSLWRTLSNNSLGASQEYALNLPFSVYKYPVMWTHVPPWCTQLFGPFSVCTHVCGSLWKLWWPKFLPLVALPKTIFLYEFKVPGTSGSSTDVNSFLHFYLSMWGLSWVSLCWTVPVLWDELEYIL